MEPYWTLSAQAFSHHTRDLEPMLAPQSPHALVVDVLGLIEQSIDAPVAVARVLGGQPLHLRHGLRLVSWMSSVAEGRAMQVEQGTGTLGGETTANQEVHRLSLVGHAQPFFPRAP